MHVAWIWFWLRNIEKKALFSDLHHTAPLLTDKNDTCSKKGETVWCSSFSRNEWQMPSWDRKEELPYYQMIADRSSNARVGNNYTHSWVSKTNKGNSKDTGTAALLVRSATKPVPLCTCTRTVAPVPGQITASTAASRTNHKWHYCLFAITHPSYLHLIVTWHLKEKSV